MHTPTCRRTHTHKHLQVVVLEFMGHLIYRHTICLDLRYTYTKGDRLCFQRNNVKRYPSRISFMEKDFLSVGTTVEQPFRTSVRGRLERRGEGKRKNCHLLALSQPIPPSPSRRGPPLSRLNPGGNKQPPGRGDLRETLISSFNTMIVLTIFKL